MSSAQFKKAVGKMSSGFFEAIAEAMALDRIPEFNYFKTVAELPNGGKYLVLIQHLEGPKVDLPALREKLMSGEE